MSDDDPRVPLKAMLWEEAKGKLRAFAAVQGSYPSGKDPHTGERWEQLDLKIEQFITDIENNALHE